MSPTHMAFVHGFEDMVRSKGEKGADSASWWPWSHIEGGRPTGPGLAARAALRRTPVLHKVLRAWWRVRQKMIDGREEVAMVVPERRT